MNYKTEGYSRVLINVLEESLAKKYYDEPAEKIIFSSESLFTKKFVRDLNTILNRRGNSGEVFKKLPSSKKKEIVSEVDDLLQTESMWKTLIKSSKFDSQKILEIFPDEAKQFVFLYEEGFYHKDTDNNRLKNMKGSIKATNFLKGLFDYLKKDMPNIFNEKGKSFDYDDDYLLNLVEEIPPTMLFQNLVRICMKKAYDTNVNIECNNPRSFHHKNLDSNFLRAKKTEIRYPAIKYINIFLASHLLNDLFSRKLLINKKVDYLIEVLKLLEVKFKAEIPLKFKKSKAFEWFLLSVDITEILLYMFEETDVIKSKHIEKIKGSKKTNKIYIFNHKLDNSISFSENLPRIIPPVKAETSKAARDWVSPIKKGDFNIQLSDEALLALNNAQKKEFVINEKFSNLLRDVDINRKSAIEFPTLRDFNDTRQNFDEWYDSSWNSLLDVLFYRISRGILRVKGMDTKRLHSRILRICNVSHLESHANAAKNKLRTDVIKKRTMRQLLLTSLEIGEVFKKYPLYYGTRLDFRLRMYPLQYLLSRTSGYLKNLLEESVQKKLTIRGIKNMFEAFYAPDKELSSKLRESNLKKVNDMLKFFKENKLNLSDKPLYFELLSLELNDIFSKGKDCAKKTAIQLEIDQVGSGPTLVALLTRNRALAEKCNLLGGEFKCIYTYLLEESVSFFKSKNNFDLDIKGVEETKAYKLLTENRKAQKYALMCFFYNEEHLSRTDRWKEQFQEEYGTTIDSNDYLILSKFSINYDVFLDSCFPKLSKQLALLNETVITLVKQNLPVKIGTLDGCIISWDFANVTEIRRSIFNPVSEKHEQVKVHINTGTSKPSHSRLTRHKRSFRPNFVHSIDAAIMRLFLQKFYKKTKRRLNHLHDCVMLHPNDVDVFYDIVTDIYCSPELGTMANDLFFSRIKKDLAGEPLKTVINLEEQFNNNMDDFQITKGVFEPRHCYRFEGTK